MACKNPVAKQEIWEGMVGFWWVSGAAWGTGPLWLWWFGVVFNE